MKGQADSYSLLTITHNRDQHLLRLLNGVVKQTHPPTEVIVVFMNQPEHPRLPDDLKLDAFDIQSTNHLPLARARNCAADNATQPTLVFLDVDCVPAPNFGATIVSHVVQRQGLVMATPRYLAQAFNPNGDLHAQSAEHPARTNLPLDVPIDPALFWSLCFGISAPHFDDVGGFDETFVGYGGEDTDFARACAANGYLLTLSSACAYHQYHPSHRPPLNHFDDIIRNATAFYVKWGDWPMPGWLEAFGKMGLLEWPAKQPRLNVLRPPTPLEVQMAATTELFG